MNDPRFIPPSDRESEDCYDCGTTQCDCAARMSASHAVVDSIAAELADALRKVRDRYYNQSGVRSGGAESPSSIGFAALERFDNLNNNKEQ